LTSIEANVLCLQTVHYMLSLKRGIKTSIYRFALNTPYVHM